MGWCELSRDVNGEKEVGVRDFKDSGRGIVGVDIWSRFVWFIGG